MKHILLNFIFILSLAGLVSAQGEYVPPTKNRAVQKIVTEDGDTILAVSLREVNIPSGMDKKKYYDDLSKMIYHVRKVYPYAQIAAEIINEYDSVYASLDRRRDKKRFMRHIERDLKDEFADDLKNLTVTQGKYLIKLINRETGTTSFDIIKNLKGGLSAYFWQGLAKLFGGDLKDEYQKDADDAMLEYIVKKIERGEIYVPPRERKTVITVDAADKKY